MTKRAIAGLWATAWISVACTGSLGDLGLGPGETSDRTDPTGRNQFTRLTRNEYRETVIGALGVEPNLDALPSDNRVGGFTSNATVGDDPVHPYLLSAEDIASRSVPGRFPSCTRPSVAECVRTGYREAFELLLRRPLRDEELATDASFVERLLDQNVSAEDATRALVASKLIHPDFLYRSSIAGDRAVRARRLSERTSFALFDRPAAPTLVEDFSAPPEALRGTMSATARSLLAEPAAIPNLARFLAQWLHLDIDQRLANGTYGESPRYRELLAATRDALERNLPIRDLIRGTQGYVHRDNFAAYGLEGAAGNEEVSRVTWARESPRRGLLSQELFADATRHPDATRRPIFRGRVVRSHLLCEVIPSPNAQLLALAGEVTDRTADPRCSACHQRMEPVGRAFAALDLDLSGQAPTAQVIGHPELEGSYESLPELLDAVATSRAFAECFARNWLSFFLEQDPSAADEEWIRSIADAIEAGGGFAEVLEGTLVTLADISTTAEPWCPGP